MIKTLQTISGSPAIAKYIRDHSYVELSEIKPKIRMCDAKNMCPYPTLANCNMCLKNNHSLSAPTKSYVLGGMTL